MTGIFADTSGLANLVDHKQPFHRLAVSIYRDARTQSRRFLTTNYILAELVATLTSPLRTPRSTIVEILRDLRSSQMFEVFHVDRELDEQGHELLGDRQDKEWSLVDCVSFSLMQQQGVTEALTTDHHFEQAGFVRLLK